MKNRFSKILIMIFTAMSFIGISSKAHAQLKFCRFKFPHIPIPGADKIPDLSSIGSLINEKEPITTNSKEVRGEIPFIDDYSPENSFPLNYIETNDKGFQLVKPGLYQEDLQTYCLHAGTYGPSRGEGYLYAPLKGGRAKIIKKILSNSFSHPEIPQQDIQPFKPNYHEAKVLYQ